jgi:hypothetical protein
MHGRVRPGADIVRGEISAADARRILAREVAVRHEGDIAVLLVPEGKRRVRVELRAFVDEDSDLVCRPQLVLEWMHGGEDREPRTSSNGKAKQR